MENPCDSMHIEYDIKLPKWRSINSCEIPVKHMTQHPKKNRTKTKRIQQQLKTSMMFFAKANPEKSVFYQMSSDGHDVTGLSMSAEWVAVYVQIK